MSKNKRPRSLQCGMGIFLCAVFWMQTAMTSSAMISEQSFRLPQESRRGKESYRDDILWMEASSSMKGFQEKKEPEYSQKIEQAKSRWNLRRLYDTVDLAALCLFPAFYTVLEQVSTTDVIEKYACELALNMGGHAPPYSSWL